MRRVLLQYGKEIGSVNMDVPAGEEQYQKWYEIYNGKDGIEFRDLPVPMNTKVEYDASAGKWYEVAEDGTKTEITGATKVA